MRVLSRVRFSLRTLFDRAGLERQLDEELQFHLEMQAAAHRRLGQSPVTAYARARREFGEDPDQASARSAGTVENYQQ